MTWSLDGYEVYRDRLLKPFAARNFTLPETIIIKAYMNFVQSKTFSFAKYVVSITKGLGYPIGLALQILTVLYLVRGSTGLSRSARNWFLLVVGADIASTVYRVYELVTEDLEIISLGSSEAPGRNLMYLMWGLKSMDHALLQDAMCRLFFVIIYFPVYLSPIALTISSMIRCYCVKYPLRSKVYVTKCLERCLILLASFLALSISITLGVLTVKGTSSARLVTTLGITVHTGRCPVPKYSSVNTDQGLLAIGFLFMLTVVFLICLLNFVSAIVTIIVLFISRRSRLKMTSSTSTSDSTTDAKPEIRATAMLLGMNVTLFVCFFLSRLLLVISTLVDPYVNPVWFVLSDRIGAFLFTIPNYMNALFIAGFSPRFYAFVCPCTKKHSAIKSSSSDSRKTL